MAVCGIDFGNLSLLIGQTSKGGVDVILNESSNRQTATAVSIQGKQRFIGDPAAAMQKSNIKDTVMNMKLLVGRKFDDPDVQKEIKKCFYQCEKLAGGGVGVSFNYNDAKCVVPVEHFMAMMLTKAKDVVSGANSGVNLADAVLAVPAWFTESQRRAINQACEIANVNCLKVGNEMTLIALSYGIFKSAKSLFSPTDPTYVMFVDIGFTSYSVTIVDFKQEYMKVLATVTDRELGGRDFDDVIIEALAEQFEAKTKINVRKNPKAILKLQSAAEKAKKTLSPFGVSEANISAECLAEDIDLNTTLTRENLESRAAGLVARLRAPVEAALAEAGLNKEQIAETEILGGSSRINIIKRTLGEIMGLDAASMNYGLKTTMNADEAVARGGALQCAMLSSRMKVKPFQIIDRMSYGISATYQDVDDESKQISVNLYTKGDEVPHKPRRINHTNKSADFTVTIGYDDAAVEFLPPGESRHIGTYTVQVPKGTPPSVVRVTWNLDKNGFVYCQSAELLEELPVVVEEIPEGKESEGKDSEGKDGEPAVPKKKTKKTELVVVASLPGLTAKDIKDSLELEAQMAYDDRLITETADKRNELESYIYGMRGKLDGALKAYCTAAEKDDLKKKLDTAEDWLYNEGFDVSKQEYNRQIDDLRSSGDDIEERLAETTNRPPAIDALKKQIELCKAFTAKYDDNFAHITEEERDSVRKETTRVENWMYDQQSKQGNMPLHTAPVLTARILKDMRAELVKNTKPVMNKPKPAPVAPPVPKPAAKEEEKEKKDEKPMKEEAEENKDSDEAKSDLPEPPAAESKDDASEPMDQAK